MDCTLTLENFLHCRHSEVTDCGKYLLVLPQLGCKDNLIYYSELPLKFDAPLKLTCIVDKFEADFEVYSLVIY